MTTRVLPDSPVLSAFGISEPRADNLRLSLETSGDTVVSIRERQKFAPRRAMVGTDHADPRCPIPDVNASRRVRATKIPIAHLSP